MTPVAMDFYWKRSGLRWLVMSEERSDGDWGNRKVLFTCWREKTAANVCLRIFEVYGLGCDIGRARAAPSSHNSPTPSAEPNNG